MNIAGKSIIVTGACGIIGAALVKELRAGGARVIALDLPDAIESAREAYAADGDVHLYGVDLSDLDNVQSVSDDILAAIPRIDGLVNNAASKGSDPKAFMKDALEITPATWREVATVNLDGTFFLTQAIGRSMVEAEIGSIVFVGSIWGQIAPDPRVYEGSFYLDSTINTPPVYSATKSALGGLTRYLAAYWGKHQVRVNCICPGGVFSGQNDAFVNRYIERVPMRRMAQPDDITKPIRFFLSEEAAYINGQTLIIDGGLSAW